ncbi:MAG: membrane protein insertase YidC [Candidatus Omnitrophota bacterium]
MEKRLILAMALSLLLLLAWSAMMPKQQHIDNKEVRDDDLPFVDAPEKTLSSLSARPSIKDAKVIEFHQDRYTISFIESLAAIKEVIFNDYQSAALTLQNGLLLDDTSLSFSKQNSSANEISFLHLDQSRKVIKKFIFSKSLYDIQLEITIENLSDAPLTSLSPLVLGTLDFSSKNPDARYQDVTVATKEKVKHESPKKDLNLKDVDFLALRDRYFCAIIEPELGPLEGYIKKAGNHDSEIGLGPRAIFLPPGQAVKEIFHIYLGPQDLKLIQGVNSRWAAVVHYGTFDFISQILLQLLQFFYGLVHNWGWAIIILSIAVYLALFPLSLKQMRSMKEMQALQPHIEELKRLYKDNPQRMQKEQMELFRKHKVNPFGGCLPLLLQMPIFFALYQTLMRSVFLRGATFLWIKDLSGPDRLFSLPFPKPFDAFNLLPILMTIGMFIQQKITTASATGGSSAEQQRIMMIMMPLLFGFIFYSMPAGLVLYWFINSTLMLANQFYQLNTGRIK